MPELPEIITLRNDLKNVLIGKRVVKITTHKNYSLNPSKYYFLVFVLGSTIVDIFNIAKLLVLKMTSGHYVCVHLKMTGNLLYNIKDKYTKITFELDDGSKLHYSTIRKLGYFEVWDQKKLDTYAKRFGKPFLESNLEPKEFISLLQGEKTNIRSALLDQSLVSGIGNIYANEALFLSKVHPKTIARDLDVAKYELLFEKLKFVLNEGLKNRGSSIDRYKDIFGVSGSQQDHFFVYGKKGTRCTQCNASEIQFEKVQGRGIYFCPNCQIL